MAHRQQGYALVLALLLAGFAHARPLSFAGLHFDPLLEADRFAPVALTAAGAGLHLVQFHAMPDQQARDALSAAGWQVLQYYPQHSYLVWGDAGAAQRSQSVPGVRWQGGFSRDWKLAPALRAPGALVSRLTLLAYDNGDLPSLRTRVEALGAIWQVQAAAQPDGALQQIWLQAGASSVAAISALPQVLWIESASERPQLEDEITSQIVAGNYDFIGDPTGPDYLGFLAELGLGGNNVTFAVVDSGIDYGNPEFFGRIVAGFDYPGCESAPGRPGDDRFSGGHGTHVAGILGAAGVVANATDPAGYHYGIGIAPQARLVSLNPLCGNLTGPWPPPGGWQDLSRRSLQFGAIGANYSWTSGEGSGVGYNSTARAHDVIVRDGNFDTPAVNEAFVVVSSAGNSGPGVSTITAPKEAKNLIVVGSGQSPRSGSIGTIAGNSSRGPARDGRILPTVVAPGVVVSSTRRVAGAINCANAIGSFGLTNYAYCSGTSMAAAQASGVVTLLVQWWRQHNAGANPSPALLKALLINGAQAMAGSAAVPNNDQGWGRIHLQDTLGLDRHTEYLDQSVVLDRVGAVHERSFRVPGTSEPVRVTLVWTDAPGATGADPALVNDLDLEVIRGGQLYRGNWLQNGVSVTGGSSDSRNNVENVFLPPGSGDIVVRVVARSLPGDGVPNHGDDTDQDFALVCSNCELLPQMALDLDPTPLSLCQGDVDSRTLQLQSAGGYNAAVSLSALPGAIAAATSFVPNPVPSLPGTAQMLIDSALLAEGSHTATVRAQGPGQLREALLEVFVASSVPDAPSLQSPLPESFAVPLQPVFSWTPVAGAFDYRLEIATDPDFQSVVHNVELRQTNYTSAQPLLSNTQYHWRVLARNACPTSAAQGLFADGFELGSSAAEATGSFTTVVSPEDCAGPGGYALLYAEDMEHEDLPLPPGWSAAAAIGSSNWVLDTEFPFTGTRALRAIAPDSSSDQSVTMPELALPELAEGLWLRFMQRLDLEPNYLGCADGGLIEVSVDGAAFTAVAGHRVRPAYSGNFHPGNPAFPGAGWCGTAPYRQSAVDLSEFAGQSVRLRFRLTSGPGGQRPDGWAIDSVEVRQCLAPP